jgi:hypothetical protein
VILQAQLPCGRQNAALIDISQPVKLSDEFVLDARLAAEVWGRSLAGQIEFWAQLGRVIEPLLSGTKALALRQSGKAKPISECLRSVDSSEGRRRVAEYLAAQPFPPFEAAAGRADLLVRIEADGTRTVGRFVDREFKAIE